VDVVAPCALGGALDRRTIDALRATIVAGSANNQLASDDMGELLTERGILYAPDYVINAGGVISIAHEYLGLEDAAWVERRVAGIAERLEAIFRRARDTGTATSRIADEMAREHLGAAGAEDHQLASAWR
jgi:leucine dehydrogenase